MELSGAEVKKLRLALKDAFQESELKRFLREELDLRWSEDIEGGTYDAKISSLITLVESRGVSVFQKLVIGIAGERSDSEKIKEFVEIKIADLIEYDTNILSSDALICLINILEKIVDFNKIWIIGKAVLPNNIECHCSNKIEYLENSELSNWFKCFIFLRLFLEDYPILSDCPSIVVFVQKLLQETFLTSEISLALETWLQEVDASFIPQKLRESTIAIEKLSDRELKAHLMITVDENHERPKFRVIASLLCVAPTGEIQRMPVDLDLSSKEKGILSTKKQLPKKLSELIQKSLKILQERLENGNKLLGCDDYKLFVELFLPIKLLCEPIDREKIFGDHQYLATKYPLVIRSYDRCSRSIIDHTDLWNEFYGSWKQSRQILELNPEANLQDLIQSLNDVNNVKLMAFQERLRNCMGVKSNCSLPTCQKQMYQLLLTILKSGIPIIFLPRNNEPSPDAVIAEMEEEFLQINLLRDRCRLLETVRSSRAYALDHSGTPEKRWLRHLTLIWDDPERMPLMNALQTGGAKAS
ncbi:VMAP-C domain-containing protein [Phormidium tenue]|uniref:Uncharacterized protein n=1 Tax=Phormidium tenue FACHB-1050 TaxID=2692857 RepID=A0ABR8CFE4_9CYAN|nr:effector-associated domain EAD1-containing protein [Phormidium tenue]MBD2319467.1 hypothetical protein [Phormidium tenue FACHB-1050]